jgi:hypothetical protein
MAKSTFPMKTGSGIIARLVWLLVGLAVLMLVIKYPGDLAGWVKAVEHVLTSIVSGMVAFFRQLAN